ncbi:MAG: FHA domain-containing protein [Prevotellaceae bacterium]|jgi:hypothetical protein|nr:FHA domain-containing protein [Prevotellaceae bacterium]
MKVITVGRNPGNNVVINDLLVSKNHCQIIQDDYGNFSLVDNNSTNGTFVNGQRRQGQVRLNRPDIVRIGNTTLPWNSYFAGSTLGGGGATIAGPQAPVYYPPPADSQQRSNSSGMGVAALCCGIVGLLFAGIILGTLAIIFGSVGLKRREKNRGLSITGLVLGIIDVVLSVIYLAFVGSLSYWG